MQLPEIDPTLTPKRKDAMHLIMCGDMRIAQAMFVIHQHVLCDHILEWLIRREFIGQAFLEYVTKKHKGSTLSLISYVVAMLKKQAITRPVLRTDFVN